MTPYVALISPPVSSEIVSRKEMSFFFVEQEDFTSKKRK